MPEYITERDPSDPEDGGNECPTCRGFKGQWIDSISLFKGPLYDKTVWEPCPDCKGQGRIY